MADTTTIWLALLGFQSEGVTLQKNGINPHYKNQYPTLDNLIITILPELNKHGLVVLQMPCYHDGEPALTTRLIHAASGEQIETTMPLMLSKNDPQGQGSAITYARRYALMSVLGLVADEDTDGNMAARPAQRTRTVGAPAEAGTGEGAPNSAPVPAAPKPDPAAPKLITVPQRKRLHAIRNEHGVTEERAKEIIQQITGQDSSAGIPVELYDTVIQMIALNSPADNGSVFEDMARKAGAPV